MSAKNTDTKKLLISLFLVLLLSFGVSPGLAFADSPEPNQTSKSTQNAERAAWFKANQGAVQQSQDPQTETGSTDVIDQSLDALATPSLVPHIGINRYETAHALATAAYPSKSNGVVIASGEQFPDALGASALAGALDYPIILTQQGQLPGGSYSVISNLKGGDNNFTIYIIGLTGAVSQNVQDQLQSLGQTIRIGGVDRYATNRLIFTQLDRSKWNADTCILATGTDFADALSASSLAASEKMPIVLINTTLGGDQLTQISSFKNVLVMGGTARIPNSIIQNLNDLGKTVTRYSGSDRYETSIAIAKLAVGSNGFTLDEFIFTTGQKFPDALAAGVLGAKSKSPIILIDNNGSKNAPLNYLRDNRGSVNTYHQAGGYNLIHSLVPSDVATALSGYSSWSPAPVSNPSVWGNGMYRVGTDIQAGEYIIVSTAYYGNQSVAYYEVAKDSSGQPESIVVNDFGFTFTYQTVSSGQYLLLDDAKAYLVNQVGTVRNVVDIYDYYGRYVEGRYKVGIDITAGQYNVVKLPGTDYAYYEVCSNSSNLVANIITNGFGFTNRYITVTSGQYIAISDATMSPV